nr:hypothetical protein [Sporolactobacillus nakayamae]
MDRLNERIILHALREEFDGKTMILVSHRQSALNMTDTVYDVQDRTVTKIR